MTEPSQSEANDKEPPGRESDELRGDWSLN